MRYMLRILLLSVIIGYAKAHSFIKLVILAGLGLAGLFMVHTLAMDFNNIVQSGFGGSAGTSIPAFQAAGGGLSAIFKNTIGGNNNNNEEEEGFGQGYSYNNGPKVFDGHGKLYDEHEIKNVYKRSEIEAKTGKVVKKRSTVAEEKPKNINWQLVLSKDPASCARSFICQLAATKEQDLSKEDRIILQLTKSSTEGSSWASKQIQEALKHGLSVTYPYQCMKEYKFCPYTKNMMMTLLKFFSSSR